MATFYRMYSIRKARWFRRQKLLLLLLLQCDVNSRRHRGDQHNCNSK